MKNKKGFTLIELLAVIVILAIIMVIAVPKILDIINGSRRSAWNSNVKLIKKSIEINTRTGNATVKGLCDDNETTTDVEVTNKIKEIASFDDTNITCKKDTNYIFTLTGINQFNGRLGTITCTSEAVCTYEVSNVEPAPAPVAFATDSWATIAQNTTSSIYQVGDQKEIQMDLNNDGTPETYKIRIVNKTSPSECSSTNFSKTSCGFVIEFLDIISMNRINPKGNSQVNGYWSKGGWEYSELRNYLNNDFYDLIPSDLKGKIIDTKVFSGHGPDDSANFETTDKIYIMDLKEIYGASAADLGNNIHAFEKQLDYYAAQQALNHNNNAAIKKYNGSAATWWLRSATTGNNTNFSTVDSIGFQNADFANNAHGLVPAFRISN